jgi:hypothetical protein
MGCVPDEVPERGAGGGGDMLLIGVAAPGFPRTGGGGVGDVGRALAWLEGGLLPAAFRASTMK